jgi:hypothetical protein
MRRHSKMHDLTTGMIQDHKDVQDLKANSRHRRCCDIVLYLAISLKTLIAAHHYCEFAGHALDS